MPSYPIASKLSFLFALVVFLMALLLLFIGTDDLTIWPKFVTAGFAGLALGALLR